MNHSSSFLSATSAPLRLCVERNRRSFLRDACCGFGGLAFASLLGEKVAHGLEPNDFVTVR